MPTKRGHSTSTSCPPLQEIFHADIRREFIEDLLKQEGDFLIRKSQNGKSFVASIFWKGAVRHCQVIEEQSGMSTTYSFGVKAFKSVEDLIEYHFVNKTPLTDDSATQLLNA